MLDWIINNIGTVVVGALLAAAVAAVIIKLIKDKRAGKSSCGCNCSGCPMSDKCHKK
ncbi:MAG: FeoB-associated Cys-rich membrane protein [Acutalibacteraceae bacterium]|nr:FeoB-associated Cys-rich membrane protein [Clostridia bacterium]MEE1127937.1 FeoB-associated Cys-rich membrane protein [Acutalibacteraceae bacterium]MBQ2001307.1 FeoB-associated Cys-rich membrane protein [Clostridia bacterium]MBQ2318538.1 FeoB-associated Cys-rich membrane protein [Clostridia bacterium]MBQ2388213.1 FeoB-associated Cys-rich membrane protein [Clostridia bacterium]